MVDRLGPLIIPHEEKQGAIAGRTSKAPFLVLLAIIALIPFGLWSRIANLDSTHPWHDETMSIMQLGGFTTGQFTQEIANHVVSAAEVRTRYLEGDGGQGVAGVLKAGQLDNREHMPLFSVLLYYWRNTLRSVPLRYLPLLFGILQLPAMLWWIKELGANRLAGWLSVALLAASPIAIFYSQELREYSLFMFLTILASAALLRAERLDRLSSWCLYSIIMLVGLLCSLLSVTTLMAHTCFMLLRTNVRIHSDGARLSATMIRFLGAAVAAVILFLPMFIWTIVMGPFLGLEIWYGIGRLPMEWLSSLLLLNLTSIFYWMNKDPASVQNCLLGVFFLINVVWACTVFSARKETPTFALVACSLVPLLFFVVLPDVFFGGQRSLHVRFYIWILLNLLVLAAVGLSSFLSSWKKGLQCIGFVSLVFVVFCQIRSDLALLKRTDRSEVAGQSLTLLSSVLSQEHEPPLLVSGTSRNLPPNSSEWCNAIQLLTLSTYLPNLRILWLEPAELSEIPKDCHQFFLFNPPALLLKSVGKLGLRAEPLPGSPYCLRVKTE